MDSETLRSIVKTAATGIPGARLFPNGLGFDARGTRYTVNERAMYQASHASGVRTVPRGAEAVIWCASRELGAVKGWAVLYGEGPTPDAAKTAAGIGRAGRRRR